MCQFFHFCHNLKSAQHFFGKNFWYEGHLAFLGACFSPYAQICGRVFYFLFFHFFCAFPAERYLTDRKKSFRIGMPSPQQGWFLAYLFFYSQVCEYWVATDFWVFKLNREYGKYTHRQYLIYFCYTTISQYSKLRREEIGSPVLILKQAWAGK